MTTVSYSFLRELEKFGLSQAIDCFNCGTCVALCPLHEGHFPRDIIRYAQIGAKDKIFERYKDLWRCLHCGLCVETCPRHADPGDFIFGLRRYLIHAWRKR